MPSNKVNRASPKKKKERKIQVFTINKESKRDEEMSLFPEDTEIERAFCIIKHIQTI